MKNISQKEFEEVVQLIIRKEVTRRQAAKDLETDLRTLNHKITELAQTNPALFEEYITVFPYKPKEIKVDIEDLAMAVIRNGVKQTSTMTGISVRSISRKVRILEETNPALYELYVHRNDRRSELEELRFQERLDEIRKRPIVPIKRVELEEKEETIRETLAEFERLVESGLSKAEAARRLGYDGYPTIWKKYQEMKRIESEKEVKATKDNDNKDSQESEGSKAKSFRDSMKADSIVRMQTDRVEGTKKEKVEEKAEGKQEEGR